MGHIKALGIKWLFTVTILLSFLPIFESATVGNMILSSIGLTVMTYLVGDLFLLPLFGMVAAAIADFGLSFILIWMTSGIFLGQSIEIVFVSLGIAYLFTMCEGLFHIYMVERILPKKQAAVIPFPNTKFQTEISKEIHPEQNEKDEKK